MDTLPPGHRKLVLVGNPNVGKSVLFGRITRQYATVSNYPGTTVTLTQATIKTKQGETLVVDTPGINNFLPNSEDEMVTRNLIWEMGQEDRIIQVIDAKNLQRGLFLTLQLGEMGCRGVVALNMWDEAKLHGYEIDVESLQLTFGATFIPTIATKNRAVSRLTQEEYQPLTSEVAYPEPIEAALAELLPYLPANNILPRALGIWALCDDDATLRLILQKVTPAAQEKIKEICQKVRQELPDIVDIVNNTRMTLAEQIAGRVLRQVVPPVPRTFWEQADKLSTHPILGFGVLTIILALLYLFVGVLGADILVGVLEDGLFNAFVNPLTTQAVDKMLPFPHEHHVEEGVIIPAYTQSRPYTWGEELCRLAHDFLVGRYGVITMAITYGFAIIFPVILTFFLAFGILEDLGYLSRLSVLLNNFFQIMGLNGKAVLPMILGLGCDTMATVTARILDTRRERLIVSFLLALAVPCSAQLAVVMFLLVKCGLGLWGTILWAAVILTVLLAAGILASRLLPGDRNPLILEVPPLRIPLLRNVVLKTLSRVEWYIKEVIPVFLIGTAVLFFLDAVHLMGKLELALKPLVVYWLGLPQEGAQAILMGFFRRDYGAAGLIQMAQAGMLTKAQILVGSCTITLFVPCIANLLVLIQEQGAKIAGIMFVVVMLLAFGVGGILHRLLFYMPWILG